MTPFRKFLAIYISLNIRHLGKLPGTFILFSQTERDTWMNIASVVDTPSPPYNHFLYASFT